MARQNLRWPRLEYGEGLEPTAIFLHADDIVATARAAHEPFAGSPLRGLSPSMMERALVARMLDELATPVMPRRAVMPPPLPPNPFLVPPLPGDAPPIWALPAPRRRVFAETRTTLAATPEPRRRSVMPLLLFVAFAAAVFAHTADRAILVELAARAAAAISALR